jgi:hypothetical protein
MDYQGMYVSGHQTSSSSRLKEDPRLRKENEYMIHPFFLEFFPDD